MLRRTIRVPALLLALMLVAALLVGALIGSRVPFGKQPLRLVEGEARLMNKQDWQTSFTPSGGGQQHGFLAQSVWYSAGSTGGHGVPPCLRQVNRPVPVQIGYLWVAHPDGGGSPSVTWVRCL
jgi:hypothetical protein